MVKIEPERYIRNQRLKQLIEKMIASSTTRVVVILMRITYWIKMNTLKARRILKK
jgi:hypothetical protein